MIRPTILLVAALVFCSPVTLLAEDCGGCEPDNMCIKHEKEQEEAFKKFRVGCKSNDPMKRLAALNAIGKLNDSHMNCRSKSVAEAIAPMLEDSDSGIRQAALDYMKSNQHVPTAIASLGKLLDKLFSKLNKPRPGGKANSAAQLEWDNALAFAKNLLESLSAFASSPEVVPYFVKAIDSPNGLLCLEAVQKSTAIRHADIVSAYLRRLATVCPPKNDPEKKTLFDSLSSAFRGMSGCPEENRTPDDPDPWLAKANAWWKAHQAEFGK